MKENMETVREAARAMGDAVYQMAQDAMRETNPHTVAWIMTEYNKLDRIVRRLHSLTENRP